MRPDVLVVDNLLSAERENLPDDSRVSFVEGSIADDGVLASLEDDRDYVFHLATYHGNQSSIADPIADHDNNLVTTLKLYERLKDFTKLKKVVYSASGCTLAPHEVYDEAAPTTEDGPVPLDLDSPYQISKVVGEFYSVYYHASTGSRPSERGSRTSTGRARCSEPASGVARPQPSGGTSRRPSSIARSRGCRSCSTTAASRRGT